MKHAVLTTSFTRTELRGGGHALLKLWLLLPNCGDGEKTFVGVADARGHEGVVDVITEAEAVARAERAGFTVTTHDEWMKRLDALRGAA